MHLTHALRSCRPAQQGLTLIELLVAITLLALIASLSWRGLSELQHSSAQLSNEARRWQDLAALFQRMESDLQQVAVRPIRYQDASPLGAVLPEQPATAAALSAAMQSAMDSSRLASLQGQALVIPQPDDVRLDAALEFTRKSASGRPEVRLGYRLRGQQLERLIWPVLDRAPDSRPQIHGLLDEVSQLKFQYLDQQGLWHEQWPASLVPGRPGVPAMDAMSLPRAVRVTLELSDGLALSRIFALPR